MLPVHNEDLDRHMTLRLIYVVIFCINIAFMGEIPPLLTGIIAVVAGFLIYGQQLAINDIKDGRGV